MSQHQTRRKFLQLTTLTTAGVVLGKRSFIGCPAYIKDFGKPKSIFKGVQVGVITYSFRSMPGNSDIEQIIQYCKESNVSAVELMADAVEEFAGAPKSPPFVSAKARETDEAWQSYMKSMAEWRPKVAMTKYKQVRKMFREAGISIYGFKPRVFDATNTDAEFDYAFRAAKVLGANQVNVEFPEDHTQTKRFAEIAGRHKICIGYHGHLQQRFDLWDNALRESRYNAVNLDMGHYIAAGFDPIPFIKAKHDRIDSIHFKDRKSKENGGANLPWGQGDTPIIEVLQLMSKSKYAFPATIELEYNIPPGSDGVKEVAKCVEFAKKALGA